MDHRLPTEDRRAGLSLGHQAEIGRIESALFGSRPAPVEIGGFAITRTLGRGAFGTVYEARDATLGRNVAIKMLARSDANAQSKLLREAAMMATVTHPNVAAVYEVGTFELAGEPRVFVVMEFVDGATLRTRLRSTGVSDAQRMQWMIQAGRGLAAAHAANVVHRDFKPDNVLVGLDERVRVVDFGLAATTHTVALSDEPLDLDPTSDATATRGPVGTPAYMAPELFEGAPADPLSDQFAFCVTLHEVLYGKRPFAGTTLLELVSNIAAGKLQAPDRAPRDTRARRVVSRGLSADPTMRYASMDALLAELDARRWTSRWPLFLGGSALAVAAGNAALTPRDSVQLRPACSLDFAAIERRVDPARVQTVRAAFAAAAPAYGEQAADRTLQRLEAWTGRWRQATQASCEREREPGPPQTLRTLEAECLVRGRDRLDRLLQVFDAADASIVRTAAKAVAALPEPARCLDAGTLLAAVPTDAAQRREASRIRDGLVAVRTEFVAGRYDAAAEALLPLRRDALALGFAPLAADATAVQARIEFEAGRYAQSRATARDAFDTAISGGDQRTAATAAILLAQIGVADHTHVAASDDWAETASKLLGTLDDVPELESSLAMLRASLAITAHDDERALAALRESVARLTAEDPEHPELSNAHGNWGTWLLQTGHASEAIEQYKQALAAVQSNLGPDHPDAAMWLLGLGSASITTGALDEAKDYLERSLRLHRASVGSTHVNTIQTLMYLGVLEHNRVDYPAAIAHFDEALLIAQSVPTPHLPLIAEISLRFADTLSIAGVHDRAAQVVARATEIYEATYPPGDARLANVYGVALVVADRAGDPEAALVHGLRGLEVSRAAGDSNPMTMHLLHETGRVLVDLGRDEAALALLDRAAAVLGHGVEDRWRGALVDYERARASWSTDRARARQLAATALSDLPAAAGEIPRQQIRAWIAAH